MHPLRFQPLLRRYLWGGTRLGADLRKPVGDDPQAAESWELVDLEGDQSVVSHGKLAGTTLGEIVRHHPAALFGRHHRDTPGGIPRFPLLLKFLDTAAPLSVQVHPNDAQGSLLSPPSLGKTEAWVILAAEAGSKIYAGLKRGFDRDALAREVARGTCELCLHSFEPRAGDCVYLPAGAVHALGAGILLAEIQQTSDITYRLYDWNRVGPDGKSRALHIEESLAVIDFERGPVHPQSPVEVVIEPPVTGVRRERLATSEKFVIDRWQLNAPARIGGDDRFHILAVLEGAVDVEGDETTEPLHRGQSILIPASLGAIEVFPRPSAVLLDSFQP